ncbi:MAG: MgtC/SapB family protein [Prolixibacteraceae bacterium]|nr:MgtC/SapB family protein [Prolixibacteraceae bacterium]
MDFLNEIIYSNEINWETALLRLFISFIVGTVIGIEREAHNQPAGLRTHILICIGATLIMMLSIFIPQVFTDFQNGDPGRIAAQVVSGIGFLGAGAILKFGADVKGLTTAASIWTIAAVGLAIGAGMYMISVIAVVIILFALTVMDVFEKKIFKERLLKKIEISIKKKNTDINLFKALFAEMDIKIIAAGLERNISDASDKLTFVVGITRKTNVQMIVEKIEANDGVVCVSVELML